MEIIDEIDEKEFENSVTDKELREGKLSSIKETYANKKQIRSEKIKEKKELKKAMISDIRNQKAEREMAEERRVLFQTAMMESLKTLTESLQQQS